MRKIEVVGLEKLPGAPELRYGHSTCVVGSMLYLFGGSSLDGKEFYNDLHILDLESKKWIEKIDAPEEIVGRHFHTCVATREEDVDLIIFGGKSNGYKNDVITFNIKKKEFKVIEPQFKDKKKKSSCVNDEVQPPSPRYGHSACYSSDKIFIFGGYDRNGFTKNDLYSFSFKTNMWKKYVIAQIPYRYHHSGVFLDGDYFILGGITKNYTPLNDVYRLELPGIKKKKIEDENEGEEEEEDTKIEIITKEEEEEENKENKEEEYDDHAVEAFKLSIQNPIASYGQKCFVFENQIYMYGGRDQKREFKHMLCLQQKGNYGDLKWKKIESLEVDEEKLNVSYGSLDIHKNELLFFGGQFRGEKKIPVNNNNKKNKNKNKIEEEEEEEYEEKEDLEDLLPFDRLPYDTIFEILSYLEEKEIFLSISNVSKIWAISIAARSDRIWAMKYKKEIRFTELPSFLVKKVKRRKTCFEKYRVLKFLEKDHKERNEQKRIGKLLKNCKRDINTEHVKTVLVGDGAVGKTCLLISYATNKFPTEYVPTVFDNFNANVLYENKQVELGLWDVGGEEDYDQLRPLSYYETSCFLVCFSIVDPVSFENVRTKWIPEITLHNKGTPWILCGTKRDLKDDPGHVKMLEDEYDQKPITTQQGEKMAKQLKAIYYFETSAKTGKNVKEVFQAIIHASLVDPDQIVSKDKCGLM